jgi:hypothetical protein
MWKLRGLSVVALLALVPAAGSCWTGNTWGSMTRTDIENIAKTMVDPTWSTSGFTNLMNASSGSTRYFAAGTYKGIAYSQHDPQENWSEFASKINTNNNGNDCSGFVSICWKLPFRWSTYDFEAAAANGSSYVVKLGNIGDCDIASLVRGDCCVDNYSHMVIFDAYSSSGGITTMEQTPNFARRGRQWTWSGLQSFRPIRRTNLSGGTSQAIYTMDNSDSGFTASSNWATGTSAADKFGTSYRYHSTQAISDVASWNINVTIAGTYRVQAWWSAGSNRSPSISYKLPSGTNVAVNQQTMGGLWNTLGTISLGTGVRTTTLSCWATTGYVAVADAIRYIP